MDYQQRTNEKERSVCKLIFLVEFFYDLRSKPHSDQNVRFHHPPFCCLQTIYYYQSWFQYQYYIVMKRKLQTEDLEAINKIRQALKNNSEPSYFHEDISTYEGSTFDEFHNQILSKNKLVSALITKAEYASKKNGTIDFVIYEIQVKTEQINFIMHQRYNEFYKLYQKIKKYIPFKLHFPKKNYNLFTSQYDEKVIQQRISKLNSKRLFISEFLQDLIQYIHSFKNAENQVSVKLFAFLRLKQKYNDQKFLPSSKPQISEKLIFQSPAWRQSSKSSQESINATEIQQQVKKLNILNVVSKSLKTIESLINSLKYKLTIESIKTIYFGFDNYYGLISYALHTSNQLNRISILQLVIKLLQPETNDYYQKFQKVLEKAQLHYFILDQINFMDNQSFKILYFKLLRFCLLKKQKQINPKSQILSKIFNYQQITLVNFMMWNKLQSLT